MIKSEINVKGSISYMLEDMDGHIHKSSGGELQRQVSLTDVPDSNEKIKNASDQLSKEQIKKLLNPVALTPSQTELLSWHHRLHHLSFEKLRRLALIGAIPRRLANVKPPLCVSCIYGAAHRRPWRTSRESGVIKKSGCKPGETVSVDQLVSAQPGLLPQMTGKLTHKRVWGATVFYDHGSDYSYVHLMTDLTSSSTIEAKHAFERKMATYDVTIKHYHADNGRFNDIAFREDCKKSKQKLTFCGVGAHHQNGVIENHIKLLSLNSRTILLHAKRMWPEMISTMLWPFALKTASERHDILNLDSLGVIPEQKLSKSSVAFSADHHHTWGCPVYVLEAGLQSSFSQIPKWQPRSKIGVYVGHLPSHAGSVALVLDPSTGHVSAQFHVVFDDNFLTVPHLQNVTQPPSLSKLCQTSSELAKHTEYNVAQAWLQRQMAKPQDQNTEVCEVVDEALVSEGASSSEVPEGDGYSEGATSSEDFKENSENSLPSCINLETAGLCRLERINKGKPPSRFSSVFNFIILGTFATMTNALSSSMTKFSHMIGTIEQLNTLYNNQLNEMNPFSFAATLANNEVYTFKEAMQQPDKKEFIKAMVTEAEAHRAKKHWSVIPKSEMKPGSETIMAIWSFKRKRRPDGTLIKHKARICAHGGMQRWGVSFWETYAPVVDWISIRIMLIIAIVHRLDSRSIDFVLAFPQADIDETVPIYMLPPAGFNIPEGHILKLNKSLYGLKMHRITGMNISRRRCGLEDLQDQTLIHVFFTENI